MGYPCPACDTAHPDAEHLATHLAVTAILDDDPHEAWLSAHAPDWDDMTPAELGSVVAAELDEEEFPELDGTHDHGHGRDEPRGGDLFDDDPRAAFGQGQGGDLDAETRTVVEEARDLTERMLREDEEEADADEKT